MIRNRYNQVTHLSQDTKWESNKLTTNIANKSQEVSPLISGDHKAAMNRRESIHTQDINKPNDPQKKYRLGTFSKDILLEHGANLALSSDVWESDKTKHTRQPRGQPFPSRRPQGYKEQTRQNNSHQHELKLRT